MANQSVEYFSHLEIEEEARAQRAYMMRMMVLSLGKWVRARLHGTRAAEMA
ncbi:RSP_7527 family protein [Celeribacter sp. ULVN23_4]